MRKCGEGRGCRELPKAARKWRKDGEVRGCRELPGNDEDGGGEGISRAAASCLRCFSPLCSSLVLAGSEILTRLEQLGPLELIRVKMYELHALLVNADPQGFIPKPNKKGGQEKANLLPTVLAALRRFLAVAAASTEQAPSLLPILFDPVICEGDNISNLQFERSQEHFRPIFDPFPTHSFSSNASLPQESFFLFYVVQYCGKTSITDHISTVFRTVLNTPGSGKFPGTQLLTD